jgi:hypothetical protein
MGEQLSYPFQKEEEEDIDFGYFEPYTSGATGTNFHHQQHDRVRITEI